MNQTIQETLERLFPLIGEWEGIGKGEFPTIESFTYAETFRIHRNQDATFLTYEQQTEIIDAEGNPIRKSHWESGVLRPMEDGSVELVCVQGSGRIEILRGSFLVDVPQPDRFSLSFQSKFIGNDPRVESSRREWRVDQDRFEYDMDMATTKVGESTRHLKASLAKIG